MNLSISIVMEIYQSGVAWTLFARYVRPRYQGAGWIANTTGSEESLQIGANCAEVTLELRTSGPLSEMSSSADIKGMEL